MNIVKILCFSLLTVSMGNVALTQTLQLPKLEIVVATTQTITSDLILAPDQWVLETDPIVLSQRIFPKLYYVNIATREVHRLTNTSDPITERRPQWSPDGHFLVYESNMHIFSSSENNKSDELYLLDMEQPTPQPERLTFKGGRWATWSPDGRLISYNDQDGFLTILDLTTRQGQVLPFTAGAVWSPDSQEIAFVETVDDTGVLYVARIHDDLSYEVREITRGIFAQVNWVTSDLLSFTARVAEQMDIYTFDLKTARENRLTNTASREFILGAISTNSTLIYSSSSTLLPYDSIWAQNVNTGQAHEVTKNLDLLNGLPSATPSEVILYETRVFIASAQINDLLIIQLDRLASHKTYVTYFDNVILVLDPRCLQTPCTNSDIIPVLQLPDSEADFAFHVSRDDGLTTP